MTVFLVLASGSALALLPGKVFWPYFAGLVILLIGAIAASRDVLAARGWDKVVALGPLCYAVPLAVFGAEHFTAAQFIVKMVPSWMPGAWFWTYFVGTALVAAALSLALNKQAGLAATLTALMLFLFVLMLHIPGAIAKPGDRFRWVVALRDSSFSAGALAFAGAQMAKTRAKAASAMMTIGRVVIGAVVLLFGVEQLLRPGGVPRGAAGENDSGVDSRAQIVGVCCGRGVCCCRRILAGEPQYALGCHQRGRDGSGAGAFCLRTDSRCDRSGHWERTELFRGHFTVCRGGIAVGEGDTGGSL